MSFKADATRLNVSSEISLCQILGTCVTRCLTTGFVINIEETEKIATRRKTIERIFLHHQQKLVDVNAKFITTEND